MIKPHSVLATDVLFFLRALLLRSVRPLGALRLMDWLRTEGLVVDEMLVAEPTGCVPIRGHKGVLRFKFSIDGISAHSVRTFALLQRSHVNIFLRLCRYCRAGIRGDMALYVPMGIFFLTIPSLFRLFICACARACVCVCHAKATPTDGKNALIAAAAVVQAINGEHNRLKDGQYGELGPPSLVPTIMESGVRCIIGAV